MLAARHMFSQSVDKSDHSTFVVGFIDWRKKHKDLFMKLLDWIPSKGN